MNGPRCRFMLLICVAPPWTLSILSVASLDSIEMMQSYVATAFWALIVGIQILACGVHGQESSGDDPQVEPCSCSGLDYTNGGSYLIDGTSEHNFTFTSVFNGCFDSVITPILISPDGLGYLCSPIESQPDGNEQPSECDVTYSQMKGGEWTIVVQAPDYDFTVQRQFNLTIGGAANTVVVTATPTEYVGVTSTLPATTVTDWVEDVSTEYFEPDIVTSDCYLPTDTVIYYIPGETTKFVNTVSRWSTLAAAAYMDDKAVILHNKLPSLVLVWRLDLDSRPDHYGQAHDDATQYLPNRDAFVDAQTRGHYLHNYSTAARCHYQHPNSRDHHYHSPTLNKRSTPGYDTGYDAHHDRKTADKHTGDHDCYIEKNRDKPTAELQHHHDEDVTATHAGNLNNYTERRRRRWRGTAAHHNPTAADNENHDSRHCDYNDQGRRRRWPATDDSPRTHYPPATHHSSDNTWDRHYNNPGWRGTATDDKIRAYYSSTANHSSTADHSYNDPGDRYNNYQGRWWGRTTANDPAATHDPSRNNSKTAAHDSPTAYDAKEAEAAASNRQHDRAAAERSNRQQDKGEEHSNLPLERAEARSSQPPEQVEEPNNRPQDKEEELSNPQHDKGVAALSNLQLAREEGEPSNRRLVKEVVERNNLPRGQEVVVGRSLPLAVDLQRLSPMLQMRRLPQKLSRRAARRGVAKMADYTSTVTETTYTVTSTVVELVEGDTVTETSHYITTTTFFPPAQTVCEAEDTVTLYYQGPPHTDYEVNYVTYYTFATVWVGQTQYTTSTDYPAMTRCWQGGGYYGA
ncbi:hypothetical protein B0H63DRAFT_545490 [Podospora didyma]|uniref:Uncharacterized protein n=1 Tax=Podospora didyma TaxID=330526 RepID=A0AAE0NGQ5_9PEZI|nr:hypothetical protein B0H63DRAFT_545490 [Podospora didyma]